jgi:hypothetical protein
MHDHHSHTDHSHHHHHAHGGKDEPQLDYAQKLERRLEHWRHHNEDHLDGYQQWVETSAANGYAEISARLEEVLDLSRRITERLDEALALLR